MEHQIDHPLLQEMNEKSSRDDIRKFISVSVTNDLFISTSPFKIKSRNSDNLMNKVPNSFDETDSCLSVQSKSITNSSTSTSNCNSATYFSFKTFNSDTHSNPSPTKSMICIENQTWVNKHFYDIDLVRIYNFYEIHNPIFYKYQRNETNDNDGTISKIEMIEIPLEHQEQSNQSYIFASEKNQVPNEYKYNKNNIFQKFKAVAKIIICIW